MLNITDKNTVTSTLQSALGSYSTLKGNELAFYCPFCNHHKQKLQVNTETQKWHCWTCNSGGKKLTSLLRQLDVDKSTIAKIREIYGDTTYNPQKDDGETKVFISVEYFRFQYLIRVILLVSNLLSVHGTVWE